MYRRIIVVIDIPWCHQWSWFFLIESHTNCFMVLRWNGRILDWLKIPQPKDKMTRIREQGKTLYITGFLKNGILLWNRPVDTISLSLDS